MRFKANLFRHLVLFLRDLEVALVANKDSKRKKPFIAKTIHKLGVFHLREENSHQGRYVVVKFTSLELKSALPT